MKPRWPTALVICVALEASRVASAEPLIVVEDRGGDSALPYYTALKSHTTAFSPDTQFPAHNRFREADMLPVRSLRLSPGVELPRSITAPGLPPLFLIGDDDRSRLWLLNKLQYLHKINALGFVVNVENTEALAALRALAPGLTLAPVSADDLAQRLHVRHYPVLITATAIEP